MPYLLLLFIVMPIVEIAVLIRVGGAIGLLPTLLIVILTAVIGANMLRQQGRATLERARSRLGSGEMPAAEIVEGLLLLVGGVLLLTPGFVTDSFGFACLIPASRRWLAARLSARSIGVVVGGVGTRGAGWRPGGPAVGRAPGERPGSAGQPGFGRPGATPGTAAGGRPDTSPGAGATADAASRRDGVDGEVIEGDYRRVD